MLLERCHCGLLSYLFIGLTCLVTIIVVEFHSQKFMLSIGDVFNSKNRPNLVFPKSNLVNACFFPPIFAVLKNGSKQKWLLKHSFLLLTAFFMCPTHLVILYFILFFRFFPLLIKQQ